MILALAAFAMGVPRMIQNDANAKVLTISDKAANLTLKIGYGGRCAVDEMTLAGKKIALATEGISSGIKVKGRWVTSAANISDPKVTATTSTATISDIHLQANGIDLVETWTFTPHKEGIEWTVDRRYLTGGIADDISSPAWNFASFKQWTGALLGTGGVAWCKLFDLPNASYGVHTDAATFWNPKTDACLQIKAIGKPLAFRFTRQPNDAFSLVCEPTHQEATPRQGQHRFFRDRQDIWAPFDIPTGTQTKVTYNLRGLSYEKAFDRGKFPGLDGHNVREILNTIARIGVIDDRIMGSNGWYSGYAVLHEPWFALMGLAINDPNYTANFARSLDYARDHAVQDDGMVKSRWAYFPDDATPGTYDKFGFYECQWGRLMDTQTSYVINVAEQYDLTGDRAWAKGQKTACEKALDYLLKRDTNGNHLVEMETDSRTQHRSSDWMDVIWASFESAYVNAQAYRALTTWSDIETALGDKARATYYRDYAAKLKASFNKPISEGGFWDPANRWYVYWREKDGSIHGNNLTLPVNFMAIAYGLCDDPARRAAILDKTEEKMSENKLFCWPACLYSFTHDETNNQPYPTYENGDIFLAWVETGIRAYAAYKPEIAVKYLKNVLARYEKDGLAFQRYLGMNQKGAGDDILANNSSAIVGLFRDIYGIQPKPNRLFLDPHLTPELSGTTLPYELRGRRLNIKLSPSRYQIESDGWEVEATSSFGADFGAGKLSYFHGSEASPSLTVRSSSQVRLSIESWSAVKRWRVKGSKESVCEISGLLPGAEYQLKVDAQPKPKLVTNAQGKLTIRAPGKLGADRTLEVTPMAYKSVTASRP